MGLAPPRMRWRPLPSCRASSLITATFIAWTSSCAMTTVLASETPGYLPEIQRILGRSTTPAATSREGRAELLDLDYYGWDVDNDFDHLPVDPSERSTSSSNILDVPVSRRRYGLASGTRRSDEVQLALPSYGSSSTADLGISVQTPLSPPISWNVDPDLMSNPASANNNNDDGGAIPTLRQPLSSCTFRKTGTTIVGCLADSGRTVVIAADTRATDGTTVADARCEKVHRISDNVWCCGAGTSGDIDALVRQARYTFLLRGTVSGSIGNDHEEGRVALQDNDGDSIPEQLKPWLPKARVSAVVRFFRDTLYESGGNIGANLVLGGYDVDQNQAVLVAIHPHGSVDSIPFTALGSGGLAAMSVLESRYSPDVTVEQAIRIVKEAVGAGINNDLGSGSQIDLCIIGPKGVTYQRAVVEEECLPVSQGDVASDELLRQRHSTESEMGLVLNGVNGFGSLPYAVKSRRIALRDEDEGNDKRQKLVERVLLGQ